MEVCPDSDQTASPRSFGVSITIGVGIATFGIILLVFAVAGAVPYLLLFRSLPVSTDQAGAS